MGAETLKKTNAEKKQRIENQKTLEKWAEYSKAVRDRDEAEGYPTNGEQDQPSQDAGLGNGKAGTSDEPNSFTNQFRMLFESAKSSLAPYLDPHRGDESSTIPPSRGGVGGRRMPFRRIGGFHGI